MIQNDAFSSTSDIFDVIARTALETYAALPSKGKPRTRSNNVSEWTVLAGFCLYEINDPIQSCRCIALGTGVKVLPHCKLPVHGDVVHDSHAEIIARRGLLRFMMIQVGLAMRGDETTCLAKASDDLWHLKSGLRLGMYVSTLPCGDASTYSLSINAPPSPPLEPALRNANKLKSSSPIPSSIVAQGLGMISSRKSNDSSAIVGERNTSSTSVHRGRIDYSAAPGVLRTKPGRLDSPPTTSHSCSDKIAMWSIVGLQGGLLASLGFGRLLIATLVVGAVPPSQRSRVKEELARAVGGRISQDEYDGWQVCPPAVGFCDVVFDSDRDSVGRRLEGKPVSAAESLSYVMGEGVEVLCNGTRLGGAVKRRSGEPLGSSSRSRVSKLGLLDLFHQIRSTSDELSEVTYWALKRSGPAEQYQKIKQAVRSAQGPFNGWLVSGEAFESFDSSGKLVPSLSAPPI